MIRSPVPRTILVLLIVVVGFGLTLWLDRNRSRALEILPPDTELGVGQTLLYAVHAAPDGATTSIFVSAGESGWRALPAPVPGRVTHIAASAASPGVFYAAGESGIFTSRDAGATWTAVLEAGALCPGAGSCAPTAVALDPQVPDLAYVAVGQGTLLKMTDGGESWRRVDPAELAGVEIRDLRINPAASQILYALTSHGLFVSTTGGESWSRAPGVTGNVTSLTLSGADPNLVFAGTSDAGLFVSEDAGLSWERANSGLGFEPGTSLAITALAQAPDRPTRLFAATAYLFGNGTRRMAPAGLYVSDDGGSRWARLASLDPNGPPVTVLLPLAGDPPTVQAGGDPNLRTYSVDFDAALHSLASADREERLAAARLLSLAATSEQAGALVERLDESDPEVGVFIALALGRLPADQFAPPLLDRLEKGNDEATIRLRLIVALGAMRAEDAVPALREILLSDAALARPAADALARIGSDAAWDALIEALASPDDSVHRAAGAALALAGEPAVPALLAAAADPDTQLQVRAIESLGWLRAEAARPVLGEHLADPSAEIRAAAAFALGRIGAHADLGQLQRLSETDPSPKVRAAASQAVAAIRSPAASTPAPVRLPPVSTQGSAPLVRQGDPVVPVWLPPLVLAMAAALGLLVLVAGRVERRPVRPS